MSTETVLTTDTETLRRTNEPSVDTGQASAGGAATLTDALKNWMVNEWATRVVEITEGAGKGQFRNVVSNTATVLTVAPNWTTVPDATSWYRIGLLTGAGGGGGLLDSGVSTGGFAAALVDATRNWDANIFEGKIIKILSGAANGDVRKILENTATMVSVVNAFSFAIVPGVNYVILEDVALLADVRRGPSSALVPLARQMEEGLATAGAANALTDAAKFWDVNVWAGRYVRIVAGTGANQVRFIASNTLNVLTVITAWNANPNATSKYIIFSLPAADASMGIDYGAATNSALGNMQDTTKFWEVNIYQNKFIRFLTGPAIGCVRRIRSHDVNNITYFNNLPVLCGVGSRYIIFDDVGILPDIIYGDPTVSRFVPLAKQMEEGLVTAAGVGVVTVTDANKNLALNVYAGYGLRIVSGTGAGSVRRIVSNTATIYTCDAALTTGLDSKYIISLLMDAALGLSINAIPLEIGTANVPGVAVPTIVDTAKLWMVNQWQGFGYRIYAGTGIGLSGRILSNILNALTVDRNITTGVDSRYVIFDMPLTLALGQQVMNLGSDSIGLAKQMLEGVVTTAGAGVLTVTDASQNLVANQYAGYGLRVITGTGAGSSRRIASHTVAGEFTCDAVLTTAIGDHYVIFELPLASATGVPSCNIATVNGTAQTAGDWTTLLTNQADGTQIYLGGAWRTIAHAKFIRPAGAAADIVAAVGGQIIYVIGWEFSCDADATTFKFNDSTPTDLTDAQTFMKGGGIMAFPYKTLLLTTAVGQSLQGTATVGQVTGVVWYCRF